MPKTTKTYYTYCFGPRLVSRGSLVLEKYYEEYWCTKSMLLKKFVNCLANIRQTMLSGGRGRATAGELFEIMVCKCLHRHQNLKHVTRLGGTFDQGIDILCKTNEGSVGAFQLKYLSSDPLRGKDIASITRQFNKNLDYDIDIFCLVTLFITDDALEKFQMWGKNNNVTTQVLTLESLLDYTILHADCSKYVTIYPDKLFKDARNKKLSECF